MNDKMAERVRKLLAKAADPAVTRPERTALRRAARRLMAKYGLTKAMLAPVPILIEPPSRTATRVTVTVTNTQR